MMAKTAAGGRGGARPRKPVWLEVEEREAKRASTRVRRFARKPRRRLAVVYDTDGPHVRLGILWFAAEIVAVAFGRAGVTLLFGATATIAALQTAQCWRLARRRPHREAAAAGAALLVAAAYFGTRFLGVALIGVGGGAVLVGNAMAATDPKVVPLEAAGLNLRCSLFVGFAAACVVETARFSTGGLVGLILIVAAYEVGDYLIGSGASNVYEGPVAGATAILVVTFAITAVGVEPFTFPQSFALGAMAAVLCPIGQLVASGILPAAAAPASALRRLDSLLVLAPVWALVVGRLVV